MNTCKHYQTRNGKGSATPRQKATSSPSHPALCRGGGIVDLHRTLFSVECGYAGQLSQPNTYGHERWRVHERKSVAC